MRERGHGEAFSCSEHESAGLLHLVERVDIIDQGVNHAQREDKGWRSDHWAVGMERVGAWREA